MMKQIYKLITTVFIIVFIISISSVSVFALSWDGSSGGGGGGGVPAGPNGYAVRTTGDNCLGYRFSVVDKYGNTKNGAVIVVFRNNYHGDLAYSSAYKFYSKYNKMQLNNNQNSGFSTGRTSSGCIKETSMGFGSSLPQPSGMKAWQNSYSNINPVLKSLGFWGGVGDLKNGDKILVEPLYDVRLQSVYHSVTTTELAIYGKYILGANSNGGASSNSGSWGFISEFTNKHYPNYLYTPDGQGLWAGVGQLSSRATFDTIINKGYGVGIAYTETKPDFTPSLSVKSVQAWKGSKSSRSYHYGTSYGSSFSNYTVSQGYPIMNEQIWFSVNFPAESQNCYVKQSVRISGGSLTSRNVYSNSNTWYDVALSPTTVSSSQSSYVIEAKVDYLDSSGNIVKYGAVKIFYIPIKSKLDRYQVTMYDITGSQVAHNGTAGQVGAVYEGQRVNPKYTYTSSNSWTSRINFSNTINGTRDLNVSGYINSSSPFERYSSLGYYRVPNISSILCRLNRTDYNSVILPNKSVTPDTRFEKKAPSDFVKLNPSNNTVNSSAVWSEWVYENNSFKKQTYNIKILSGVNSIVPDVTIPSREQMNGVWQMGSGYGFTSSLSVRLGTANGYLSPSSTAHTNAQSASMYLPEFNYKTANGTYRTFESNSTNNFRLPTNSFADGNARLHFIPLWYPDTGYVTQSYVHDLWTPAGMLSGYYNSNIINIVGSSYDDWYIGR